jgi:hypothetical protein
MRLVVYPMAEENLLITGQFHRQVLARHRYNNKGLMRARLGKPEGAQYGIRSLARLCPGSGQGSSPHSYSFVIVSSKFSSTRDTIV